jgi:hypothetical protein
MSLLKIEMPILSLFNDKGWRSKDDPSLYVAYVQCKIVT